MGKCAVKFALFSLFLLIILSSFVSADCCTYQGICTSSSAGCPPANFVTGQSCSALSACQMGCCCPENVAKRRAACSSPNFVPDSGLTAGSTCSCTGTFTVSGVVKKNGDPEGGALVSVGSLSTTSNPANGAYSLSGVPGGNVVISASKSGCYGSFQITNLAADRPGTDINLLCNCTPGCVVSSTSFCDNNRVLHPYNISVPAQKTEYCQYCAESDPDVCGGYSECRAGDGACPLGCGPANDSDCICNPSVRNGYCPPGCNQDSDADCGVVYNPSCGDRFVSYPFETCEPDPPGPYPGQAYYCSGSPSSCSNCNCISPERCGNGVIDSGEQCELGNICTNGNPCLDCKCTGNCSGLSINPTISATFEKATRQVVVRWAVSDACDSIVLGYYLMECKKQGTNLCKDSGYFSEHGFYTRSTFNASIVVDENSIYSYFVKAIYDDSRIGISKAINITTGSEFCMNRGEDSPPEFCMDNKRSKCDASNNIRPIEDCNAQGKYCTGPDYSGVTRCELSDPCALCNGLYGMFGKYLDLKVSIGPDNYFCNFGAGREVVPGCYFDRNSFIFNAFASCGNVKSCYDFKSQGACEDPNDPCGINTQCEWAALPSNPSLGGICRPIDVQLQDCTLCDNPLYNILSPVCTSEVCGLYGTCFYQGVNNSPSCANRIVSACTKYDTKDKCIGPGASAHAVDVDANYNSNNTRVGGTHAVSRSNDDLGLGKCYWDNENGKCRRDADGLPVNVATNVGRDCASNDFQCESDFSEPVTSILVSGFGLYPASPRIRYNVIDNYPANKVLTYFCVAPANAAACYPKDPGIVQVNGSEYYAGVINVSGQYKLYYYSEDFAKNLEVVKNLPIRIDADIPFIELLSPRNESEFAVNTPYITVQARTAPDVSFVCANNTAIKRTVCVNNCGKPAAGQPCIDDTTGMFLINVPVVANGTNSSSSTPRSVVFSAQDFAGNKYQNTLLGIIYDVDPPGAPTITIK